MGNSNIRPRSAYDGVREFAFTVLTLDALVFYGIQGEDLRGLSLATFTRIRIKQKILISGG